MIRYWNSEKYQISFLGIPKCGVTTTCAALELDINKDWTLTPLHKRAITCLREPIERFYSMHQEMLRQGTTQNQDINDFTREVNERGFFNNHLLPAYHYLHNKAHNLAELEIIKFPQLPAWIEENLGKPSPHKNKSENYPRNLTPVSISIIQQLYSFDLENYHYQIDTNPLNTPSP